MRVNIDPRRRGQQSATVLAEKFRRESKFTPKPTSFTR